MYVPFQPGVRAKSNAPSLGRNPCIHTENTRIAIIPTQKNGSADVTTKNGGRMLSIALPRFHPATVPISVPNTNARMVVTPTRPSVHHIAWRITDETDSGKNVIDTPNLPVTVLRRYWKYCETTLSWLLTPKATSNAFSADGLIRPWNLAIIATAGLPGMRRGMKKLTVSAAHRVSNRNPHRRSRNLIRRLSKALLRL